MAGRTVSVGHIEYDFEYIINEDTGETCQFYINVDKTLDKIEEFVIKKLPNDKGFDAGKGNSFHQVRKHIYEAVLDEKTYKFCTADQDYTPKFSSGNEERDWTAIDTTNCPNARYALGDSTGNIKLYDDSLGLQREFADAHASEITSLKFFPSGEVLLSSSSDTCVKLWSLIDGSCPRTFKGHSRAVTDSCMIDRGRNFLSSSADGTVRLWECGTGQTIHSFSRKENANDGVNTMDLLSNNGAKEPSCKSQLEFGTDGKQVLAGHTSGVLTLHDIFSKEQQLQLPSRFKSGCNTLKADTNDENYIYAGYQNGTLAQWDLRQPKGELDSVLINEGTPLNTIYLHLDSIYVSSGLDTCLRLSLSTSGFSRKHIETKSPTFLVSNDYQVAQFMSDPKDQGLITIGNWGFCAKY